MRVFNVGFRKSGSVSLTTAFGILGFKSVHWKHKRRRLCDIFEDNVRRNRKLLYGLEEFDFLSDFSGELFYEELDKQYPNSKFILTLRDLNTWLVSMEKHVQRNQQNSDYKYDFLKVEKDKWTRERQELLIEIKEYFKNRLEDFLIINIVNGEGWKELCSFLEKLIPDEAFPYKNKATN